MLRLIVDDYTGVSLMGGAWGVTPPAFKNFVFFEHQTGKKAPFQGFFSYSIYVKVDITPPQLFKNLPA
jgi:hypothetical protein